MIKTYNNVKDKVYGAIIGFAIGDALGAPTESYTPEEIDLKFGRRVDEMVGGGMFNWNKGQYTDDTEMMIVIGYEALKDKPNYAQALIEWKNTKPRDIGSSMQQVFNRLPSDYSGKDYGEKMIEISEEVNGEYQSLGSGAIVRALIPILLDIMISYHDPFACSYDYSENPDYVKQGWLTHADNALFIRHYHEIMSYIRWDNKILDSNIYLDTTEMIRGTVSEIFDNAQYYATRPNITHGYIDIVNRGGDTDSCAAIYGSIVGFAYGLSGLMESSKINNWIITMLTNNYKYNILDLCEQVTMKCWKLLNGGE